MTELFAHFNLLFSMLLLLALPLIVKLMNNRQYSMFFLELDILTAVGTLKGRIRDLLSIIAAMVQPRNSGRGTLHDEVSGDREDRDECLPS